MSENSSDARRITLPFASVDGEPYIFASYAHNDKDRVFPLLKELYEAGYNVWYDQGIEIGSEYDKTIKDHIKRSEVFLFFVSELSLSRKYILDDELPPARESHSDRKMIALYLEDVKKIPGRAAGCMPKKRCTSVGQVINRLRRLGLKNFGKRDAEPFEHNVPPYWLDDYDVDPTGGTKNCVHTAETPYVCLAFDPRDTSACNPYAKELLYAGYNVRSCENEDSAARARMLADPDCAAYVPMLTKKYVESGQLERDYAASKEAKKPFIALYMRTSDEKGKEEKYEVPAGIAEEFTKIQGLSISERTDNDFISELEADLEKRKCYASMWDGKVKRRAFQIPGFWYDLIDDEDNKSKGIVLNRYTGDGGEVVIKRSYGGYPVRKIGKNAFELCNLTSVTIPDSVTSIGDFAFHSCRSLTSVTIPDSVTSISDCAFRACSSLTSVTIPDSVISIGDHAFYCCENLASVNIGDGVKYISRNAFDLDNVVFSGKSSKKWNRFLKRVRMSNRLSGTLYDIKDNVTDPIGEFLNRIFILIVIGIIFFANILFPIMAMMSLVPEPQTAAGIWLKETGQIIVDWLSSAWSWFAELIKNLFGSLFKG